jgi:hypothetical protein
MMMDPSEHLLSEIDSFIFLFISFFFPKKKKGSSGNDPLAIGSSSSSSSTTTTTTAPTTTSMGEIADVDVYFKRLYSKTNNPPPISVDEFLDIMTRCKDSQIQREKVKKISNFSKKKNFFP